ncbi:TPA: cyclophilin-like fold protein [Mannheimia haemolytica]
MIKPLFCLMLMTLTTACSAESAKQQTNKPPQTQENTMNQTESPQTASVSVNGQTFTLTLENNPTAHAFAQMLPLDLTMSDHLNNEKYAALPKPLPANDQPAGQIHRGDVMLYQGDTLVLFYKSFASNYRYTKIGKIENADRLKQLLGKETVHVKWQTLK